MQFVRAPVGPRLRPPDELAVLQAVEEMHESRTLDAEPFRHRHLRQAGIGADHGHHRILRWADVDGAERAGEVLRSEEHTSELQSRGHLVCRLLLEKKKKKIT